VPPAAPAPQPQQEIEIPKSIERKWNMDWDLNDDMNKLVRYSIVCVDRENETVLQKLEETLVRDRLDESGFTAWKILEFVQRMANGDVDAPPAWRHPSTVPDGVEIHGGKLRRIGGDPMKYLRVPFQIVDRFPRERFKYEEKQIQVLRKIEERIGPGDRHDGGRGGSESSSTSPITVSAPPAGQELVIEVKPK
jgi:hypothetical protein